MNIDDTTLRVIKEVKEQIKEYQPIELSEEEIIDIVDSQIKGTSFGLKKGVSVKLPIIGRFLFNNRSGNAKIFVELNKIKDWYSEIEYNQMELEAKINIIKRNKKRWKKEMNSKLTVVELVKVPNISNGRIMYDKLSKLVENGK